jgi:hypothetical protein
VAIPLAAALLLSATVASIAVLWRNDPVSARWDDDRLVLRNRSGLVCRRLDLPYRPVLDSHAEPDWGSHLSVVDVGRRAERDPRRAQDHRRS